MADWDEPLLTTAYATWHAEMQARDVNAMTLADSRLAAMTNIDTHAKRWENTAKKFQDYDAGWNDLVLGITGGGTGAVNAAGGRTNLGLGTIAIQDADAVVITGGTALFAAITTVDDTLTLGTFAAQLNKAYIKTGLLIPVGANKYLVA
jgi:hypothetical protein